MDEFFQTVKEQNPKEYVHLLETLKNRELPNLFYKANITLDDIWSRQSKIYRLVKNIEKYIHFSSPLYEVDFLADHIDVWGVSLVLSGKESTCHAGKRAWSLSWEDSLEEEMATHSSILAWEIPWTGSLVDYSPWGHKIVWHNLATKQQKQHWCLE